MEKENGKQTNKNQTTKQQQQKNTLNQIDNIKSMLLQKWHSCLEEKNSTMLEDKPHARSWKNKELVNALEEDLKWNKLLWES